MRVKFSPQVADERIKYIFERDKITATIGGVTDVFDFREFPDGELEVDSIETDLPVQPIISARRVDGVLEVILLNWISTDASEEEKFPKWFEVN